MAFLHGLPGSADQRTLYTKTNITHEPRFMAIPQKTRPHRTPAAGETSEHLLEAAYALIRGRLWDEGTGRLRAWWGDGAWVGEVG